MKKPDKKQVSRPDILSGYCFQWIQDHFCEPIPDICNATNCPPMNYETVYIKFCKKVKNRLTPEARLKMSTLNSTFFHVFIVLPFCTIRSPFYCIFSLLGSAVVRLPLLPASHAPCIRCYASCFTSSLNNSPAEW